MTQPTLLSLMGLFFIGVAVRDYSTTIICATILISASSICRAIKEQGK
jgi:hypothetical protein